MWACRVCAIAPQGISIGNAKAAGRSLIDHSTHVWCGVHWQSLLTAASHCEGIPWLLEMHANTLQLSNDLWLMKGCLQAAAVAWWLAWLGIGLHCRPHLHELSFCRRRRCADRGQLVPCACHMSRVLTVTCWLVVLANVAPCLQSSGVPSVLRRGEAGAPSQGYLDPT